MKILCTCLPGYGHFLPMSALAAAAAAAGHEVVFATAEEFRAEIDAAGYRTFPAGLSLPDQLAKAARAYPEQHAMPPGTDRFAEFVPRMLAGVAAPPRARDLVDVMHQWRPDVLVHDETDFGGPVAAEVAGVPYADHSVGILRPLAMAELARETVAPLWEEFGVDLGPHGGLFRYLYLDVCPPSLQSPEITRIDVAHPMRNTDIDAGDEDLSAWISSLRPVPTVYVSLGTIFNRNRDVFAAILDGLVSLGVDVIVTVGKNNDPAELGPQPDHVHVERFIPQSALLPHCDTVINQGGTAIWQILAHGLPLLLLPQGANQFNNAEVLTAGGVARSLLPGQVSADAVARGVRDLLDQSGYRQRARSVADELVRMPAADEAVALLERLANQRQPLPAGAPRP